jgi:tetratricopeptide (TPR) repeat protein
MIGATSRWLAVPLVGLALTLTDPADTAGQDTPQRLPPAYLTALANYRAGDLAAAFGNVKDLEADDLSDITRRLTRSDALPGSSWSRLLTAAIMLHTEVFFIRAEAHPAPAYDPYIRSAHALVLRLIQAGRDGERGFGDAERIFARNWFLLLIAFQHGRAEIGWSRAYLEEALKLFPKEPHLTLARGSDYEMLSDMRAGYLRSIDAQGAVRGQSKVNPDRELEQAVRWFEQAIALEPGLVEARLRLGRVLYRRGEYDRAAQELDAVRQAAPWKEVRYLALVFRGMVEAARGAWEPAEGFYAEARRILPRGQAAAIASAEAAYLRGRVSDAGTTIQATLRQRDKEDPWWVYISGEYWHFESRLATLREYVRQ